jgi:hypothetical protein
MAQTEPIFKVGDRCFSHYVMGWGTVEKVGETRRGDKHGVTGDPLPDTTWYTVRMDKGSTELLDDAHGDFDMARLVPPHIAKRYGYGDDPNPISWPCEACGKQRASDPDFCNDCLADMASKRKENA